MDQLIVVGPKRINVLGVEFDLLLTKIDTVVDVLEVGTIRQNLILEDRVHDREDLDVQEVFHHRPALLSR